MDHFDVKDKVVLITGSSRGIGHILASGFASAGSRVILNGTNQETLDTAGHKLKKVGANVYGYLFDVTDYVLVEKMIPQIENEVGAI